MKPTRSRSRLGGGSVALASLFAVLALVAALGGGQARAEEGAQKTFASPEEAAKALIAAAEQNDDAALLGIFGSGSEDLVNRGDDPVVRAQRAGFAVSAKQKLAFNKLEDGSLELVVGPDAWPFPILLVNENGSWRFDSEEGKAEVLARRIGRNELEAIEICLDYVDAQLLYAAEDRDGDRVREYAQRIISTPGTRDGLYWPADVEAGEEPPPVGEEMASLLEAAATGQKAIPYSGYYWKVLTAQGPGAPGGAYSYVINGNMIAGFALVGVPASYRGTGVMSFLVSNHGTVYERDLGEKTLEVAKALTAFDPTGWTEVSEDEEAEAAD